MTMKQILLAAALVLAATSFLPNAAAEPVDCHGPLDGYQYCEVELGRCHAGEELFQGDWHAHAECQPNDGKSRCGVDAYAMPLLVTRHCGSTYTTVWPVDASNGDFCEEHPGYRQCDYPAGPCTLTVYYVYHDAQFILDPHCGLPLSAASSTDGAAVAPCHEHPGYEHCEYRAGPCTVHTYYYYHDAFYVIEPDCQKPRLSTTESAMSSPSGTAGDPCEEMPGYEQCRVDLGLCDAETRYYYHDAFYVVGANCYGKNSTCSYYTHQVYGHEQGLDCKDFLAEHLPHAQTAGPSAAAPCQQKPGYYQCYISAGPCYVDVRYYAHDSFWVIDPYCQTNAAASADFCQDHATSTFCGYEGGGCEAGVALYDNGRVEPIYRCTPP